jgi:hypothetical protein
MELVEISAPAVEVAKRAEEALKQGKGVVLPTETISVEEEKRLKAMALRYLPNYWLCRFSCGLKFPLQRPSHRCHNFCHPSTPNDHAENASEDSG